MADTFTTNLHLTLPEIGASDDTWGNKVNDDLAALDALFGTTGTGTVIVRDANNDALLSGINVTRAAGNSRQISFKTGTSLRWDMRANAEVETGSNAGTNFQLHHYDDAGSFLGTAITANRATGLVTFETTPKVGSNSIWHAGNDTALRTPVGAVMFYGGTTAPTNYLFAFGQVLSQSTYVDLFVAFGTTYNTGGEGPGNFRMPDLRDVALVGKGNMGGSDRAILTGGTPLGALLGAQTHTIVTGELPAYTPSGTNAASAVTFTGAPSGFWIVQAGGTQINGAGSGMQISGVTASAAAQTFTGNAQGGASTPFSIVQPSTVLNVIVRAFP